MTTQRRKCGRCTGCMTLRKLKSMVVAAEGREIHRCRSSVHHALCITVQVSRGCRGCAQLATAQAGWNAAHDQHYSQ